ncbi:MAG: polysaccharide deacetylase family protein [Candidatus Deferrimicrobiaceae bacterium]
MAPIPVLMYHHVAPYPGDMVTVTPETFEGQMRHLAEGGYAALSLDELLSAIRGVGSPPGKAVVLTFDDGWLDNRTHAFPVLVKYRLRAAVFVVTDWVERASAGGAPGGAIPGLRHREGRRLAERGETRGVVLDWERIREMQASGLVDFYSHTVHHAKCGRMTPEAAAGELRESKRVLEERLGRPCPYLCWPFGDFSEEAVVLAREAGYRALLTTRHGVAGPGTDPFDIPRIVVKDAVPWFARRLRVYTSPLLSRAYLAVKKS